VGINGTLVLKLKYALGTLECVYLSSTSVPSRTTTVQMPSLALTEMKRIYSVLAFAAFGILRRFVPIKWPKGGGDVGG
jgi:hypothetical protein